MQGGKLMISRGLPAAAEAVPIRREPEPRQAPAPPAERTAPAASPDYHLIHYRLAALERLSVLRDRGALSADEFAAEKALVLRLPAEELELGREMAAVRRGPSLLGRLFSPKFIAVGAAAGLCLSAFTAPQDLLGLLDRAARLIG
jgi:hypothetical protein